MTLGSSLLTLKVVSRDTRCCPLRHKHCSSRRQTFSCAKINILIRELERGFRRSRKLFSLTLKFVLRYAKLCFWWCWTTSFGTLKIFPCDAKPFFSWRHTLSFRGGKFCGLSSKHCALWCSNASLLTSNIVCCDVKPCFYAVKPFTKWGPSHPLWS